MTSTPEPDERLVGARELALAALHEITPAATVGPAAGHAVEDDGSVSLRFENRLPGYPGWFWTVTVARVDDADPTVLEVELLPGEGALVAPDWVPWAERLAEYRAHQAELAERASAEETAADADTAAGLDDDDDDDEHEVGDLLHAGDLDGVDIDELDDSEPADDEPADASDDDREDDDAAEGEPTDADSANEEPNED
ncbi:hypothetical protein GCM10025768_20670 [Microbacterium pseudoresistens]|uniref:DUF3027 domain-containing protein n=1 Tax=Microbacterium pseudoresistens TaxID=640634 RepID=A0A7Y9JN68_9MICO|nr:DUF3027 domain-containing protein [Microbacterium pseudoresistens]NYD53364.1 hypothetical protein [Microbacterium pseudoresistens]